MAQSCVLFSCVLGCLMRFIGGRDSLQQPQHIMNKKAAVQSCELVCVFGLLVVLSFLAANTWDEHQHVVPNWFGNAVSLIHLGVAVGIE